MLLGTGIILFFFFSSFLIQDFSHFTIFLYFACLLMLFGLIFDLLLQRISMRKIRRPTLLSGIFWSVSFPCIRILNSLMTGQTSLYFAQGLNLIYFVAVQVILGFLYGVLFIKLCAFLYLKFYKNL
jgi:hypothetical protein